VTADIAMGSKAKRQVIPGAPGMPLLNGYLNDMLK
jgi:hypothetical protein